MQTFKRICITEHTITDGAVSFTLKRGEEYTTSAERPNGTVKVFSSYWVDVPVAIFSGAVEFTPASKPPCSACGGTGYATV